jgi:hypothetical protein
LVYILRTEDGCGIERCPQGEGRNRRNAEADTRESLSANGEPEAESGGPRADGREPGAVLGESQQAKGSARSGATPEERNDWNGEEIEESPNVGTSALSLSKYQQGLNYT